MDFASSVIALDGNPQQGLETAYQTVFDNIKQDAAINGGVFNQKEIGSLSHVMQHHSYDYSFPHRCEYQVNLKNLDSSTPLDGVPGSDHYIFSALPDELVAYPDVTPVAAAHEFKHASLRHNATNGTLNVTKLRDMTEYFTQENNGSIADIQDGFTSIKSTIPDNGFWSKIAKGALTGVEKVITAPMKTMSFIGSAVNARLLRHEERLCDNFAVRMFPNTNLQRHDEYLKTYKTQAESKDFDLKKLEMFAESRNQMCVNQSPKPSVGDLFLKVKSDLLNDHPSEESRLRYMQKTQQRIQYQK